MPCPVLSVLINTIAAVPAAQPEASPSPRDIIAAVPVLSFPPAPSCSAAPPSAPSSQGPIQGEPVLNPVLPVATLSPATCHRRILHRHQPASLRRIQPTTLPHLTGVVSQVSTII
ncbi:hypothetical protein M0R45_016170 [Rubus argutus]|uniref:Uncharacterized protein n=1 Tax=Rubus argutus TaxID=59490 RepID=A0AAW1XTP7_RUBAR